MLRYPRRPALRRGIPALKGSGPCWKSTPESFLYASILEGVKKLPESIRETFARYGRIGGKKGGKARAARMTPGKRREAARKAVLAR